LVVFIFPIDTEKVKKGEISAGKCEEKIKAKGFTIKNADPNYREEARKVWYRQPDGSEMSTLGSIIVVDDELGFKSEDIADDFSFGNGTTKKQTLKLKCKICGYTRHKDGMRLRKLTIA
jgi:hypothetical protein